MSRSISGVCGDGGGGVCERGWRRGFGSKLVGWHCHWRCGGQLTQRCGGDDGGDDLFEHVAWLRRLAQTL